MTVNVLDGGAKVYVTNSYTTAIKKPLLHGGTAATDGGLEKLGTGTLTLAASNTYNGVTKASAGTLSLPVDAFVDSNGDATNPGALVLSGGMVSGTAYTWASLEIADGTYAYSDLPTTSAETISLTGGILTMTAAEAVSTSARKVVVTGGRIIVDGSAITSITEEGENPLTFSAITLGSGVTVGDAITVAASSFDWALSVSETTPVATGSAADMTENAWVGGATGAWGDVLNWKHGVPTSSQIVAIAGDVTATYSASDYTMEA